MKWESHQKYCTHCLGDADETIHLVHSLRHVKQCRSFRNHTPQLNWDEVLYFQKMDKLTAHFFKIFFALNLYSYVYIYIHICIYFFSMYITHMCILYYIISYYIILYYTIIVILYYIILYYIILYYVILYYITLYIIILYYIILYYIILYYILYIIYYIILCYVMLYYIILYYIILYYIILYYIILYIHISYTYHYIISFLICKWWSHFPAASFSATTRTSASRKKPAGWAIEISPVAYSMQQLTFTAMCLWLQDA